MSKKVNNPEIVIFQRIIPHYRLPIFQALIGKFKKVLILYGQPLKSETLKNAVIEEKAYFKRVKHRYFFNNKNIFISNNWFKLLWRSRPRIFICQYNIGNINLYPLFLLRPFFKYKIILWAFGYDPPHGFQPKKRLKDKIRLFFYQRSNAVIFYWEKGREVIAQHSAKKTHYFVAPNTLNTPKLIDLKDHFTRQGVEKIKNDLNISTKYHFVYVGRLLADKQIDLLLKAYAAIEKKEHDVSLGIIGDGPEKANLDALVNTLDLKSVNFLGEILDDEAVGKWIYVSDAFIMPGRLGLSVVHSFCFGTPVISQQKEYYYHGEGVGYIENGANGFLVKDGEIGELSHKMESILENETLRNQLKKGAFDTVINRCSINKMLEGFERAIKHISDKKILIVGSVPPPYHGSNLYLKELLDSNLNKAFNVIHLDTSDSRDDMDNFGKLDWPNISLGLKNFVQLVALCVKEKPDMVYLLPSETLAYLRDGGFVLLTKIFSKAKIIQHMHLASFDKFYQKAKWLLKKYIDLTQKLVNQTIVLGESLKPVYYQWHSKANIQVVPNGIDANISLNGKFKKESLPVLYFLGNLVKFKGIHLAVQALGIVKRHYPNIQMKIAGKWRYDRVFKIDEEAIKEEIFTIIQTEKLKDNVEFLGTVTGEDKAQLLKEANILVFPSVYDAFPLVILEAMAAGNPIVAVDKIGAIPDIVIHNQNGLLVDEPDPQKIANAIIYLIETPQERIKMGMQGREMYQKNYTKEKHVENMISVFRGELSKVN